MRGNNIIKWKQILRSQKNRITTSKTPNPLKGKPYLAKKNPPHCEDTRDR